MASPPRRAIHLLRRGAHELRRLRARADAVQDARRSFAMSNAEGVVALQEAAQQHIAAGTLVMGRESYFAPTVHKFKGDTGRVIVGDFASVAANTECYCGGMHRTEWVSQYGLRAMLDLPGAYEDGFPHGRGDIHIGPDTWLPHGSVPAKRIGQRFSDAQVAALLRIAWWDWPIETIKARVHLLSSPDVDAFIDAYDPGPAEPSAPA
jgi:hypothetical protein